VKSLIEQLGSENVFNTVQSDFQLEIHFRRSLSNEGVKKVECVMQSISSTIYSSIIQPIICVMKICCHLYLYILKGTGIFGPRVQEILFTQ